MQYCAVLESECEYDCVSEQVSTDMRGGVEGSTVTISNETDSQRNYSLANF